LRKLLRNQLDQVAEFGAGEALDSFVECGELAAVVPGDAEEIGIRDLLGAVHAALEGGCGIKEADGGRPESVAGPLGKVEQQRPRIAERISFAGYSKRTCDAQEAGLGERTSCKGVNGVCREPITGLGLFNVHGPKQGNEHIRVEQIMGHPSSAWARKMSSVVIHLPSMGMSAVGKPSTYFILGGLGSVR